MGLSMTSFISEVKDLGVSDLMLCLGLSLCKSFVLSPSTLRVGMPPVQEFSVDQKRYCQSTASLNSV